MLQHSGIEHVLTRWWQSTHEVDYNMHVVAREMYFFFTKEVVFATAYVTNEIGLKD